MPVVHSNAKKAYITQEGEFGGAVRMVLVIETDLSTNPQHRSFDLQALTQLIKAGEDYIAAHNRQIDHFRIIPLTDRI